MIDQKQQMQREARNILDQIDVSTEGLSTKAEYVHNYSAQYLIKEIYTLVNDGARAEDKAIWAWNRPVEKIFYQAVNLMSQRGCPPQLVKEWIQEDHKDTVEEDNTEAGRFNKLKDLLENPQGRREKLHQLINNKAMEHIREINPDAKYMGKMKHDKKAIALFVAYAPVFLTLPSNIRKHRIYRSLNGMQKNHIDREKLKVMNITPQ